MKDRIKRILAKIVNIPLDKLNTLGSDDLLTELGLDSRNIIYFITEIEQELGFTFVEDDLLMDNFSTMARMEVMISGYLKGA